MSENKLKGLAALTGLGLVGVIAAGAIVGSQSAADDLRPKAERALAAAGLDGIEVDFDGREAELSDGKPAELRRAEKIVEGVRGVRWAHIEADDVDDVSEDDDDVAQPPKSSVPTLDLQLGSGGVEVSGTVPSADDAAEIKARAAQAFGVPVIGDLTVDPAVGSATWLAALPHVFGDLVGVKELELDIEGEGALELDGSIESQAGADKVSAAVTSALPDLDIVNDIDVEAGDLTPADAATLNSATLYFARGSSALSADITATLDKVAAVLTRHDGLAIEAGGHAGPSNPTKGKQLSDARVAAVKAYLVDAGVAPGRVTTKSYGSDKQTTADAFAKQYRRVDFTVKGN